MATLVTNSRHGKKAGQGGRSAKNPSPASAPMPRTRGAIIDAARIVFIERGYAVNIGIIADAAKVSRTTLYNQFGSKEGLLRAALEDSGTKLMDSIAGHEKHSLRETLLNYAQEFERVGCSPAGVAFYRFVVSDLSNFPDLATAAYQAGMGSMAATLSAYLRGLAADGTLEAWFDPDLTAERFIGAMVGLMRHRALSTLGFDPPEKREAQIRETVETFVRALQKR